MKSEKYCAVDAIAQFPYINRGAKGFAAVRNDSPLPVGWKVQRGACVIAACCIGRRSAVRVPSQRAAFPGSACGLVTPCGMRGMTRAALLIHSA